MCKNYDDELIDTKIDLAFKQGWEAALEEVGSICKSVPVLIGKGNLLYLGDDDQWHDLLKIMYRDVN